MASGRVYQAIEDFLTSNWTSTPIAYENKDKDKAGNPLPPQTPAIYVSVELAGRSYDQASIGAPGTNRWDEEGTLFLNVNVPKGWGAKEGRDAAKEIVDLFRERQLLSGSLEFRESGIGQGEASAISGQWWMIPAYVNWRYGDEPIDT